MSTERAHNDPLAQEAFRKLKVTCVPLLGASLLSPAIIPKAISLLDELLATLRNLDEPALSLTPSVIQYVFFPLSTLLQRNAPEAIPDRVLEQICLILAILCEYWWWTCDEKVWEQMIMLAGSVLLPAGKPPSKERDDHAKDAACMCLWALLRERNVVTSSLTPMTAIDPAARFSDLRERALAPHFVPILGQLVTNILSTAFSTHLPLQLSSLRLLHLLISSYLRENYSPTVLPGVVSAMCKLVIPRQPTRKSWQNGDVVVGSLHVLDAIIVQSINDDVCTRDQALKPSVAGVKDLADLVNFDDDDDDSTKTSAQPTQTPQSPDPTTAFVRSPAWLQATSSQLHMALNTLTSLLNHPTPKVHIALIELQSRILIHASSTLSTTRPLLLSNLLTLSVSTLPAVSSTARIALVQLLDTSIFDVLLQMTQTNMSALPHLIPSLSDAKVQHTAQQIEAVCLLSQYATTSSSAASIRVGIEHLLGPNGGIERWGYSLLNVLEFTSPVVAPSSARLFLEGGVGDVPQFPAINLRHVTSRDAHEALERMLRALGNTGDEECLFAVEWFVERGSVAALWCAARLLEGVGHVELGGAGLSPLQDRGKRLEKVSRWIVKVITGKWDADDNDEQAPEVSGNAELLEPLAAVEYKKGVTQLTTLLDIKSGAKTPSPSPRKSQSPELRTVLYLHLIAISASILANKFRSSLLHAIYPVLHALVNPNALISSTAQATLQVITDATAYASPANLLLANFDYALNGVSLRLTRSQLDVQATRVLVVLVRLVGKDVVDRAGDVVEECFHRLDEYHGYGVVVEGLIQVLSDVVDIVGQHVELDGVNPRPLNRAEPGQLAGQGEKTFDAFTQWFQHRHDPRDDGTGDDEDFGPVPQKGWGEDVPEGDNEEAAAPPPVDDEPKQLTQTQALTQQIISRSLYFLTHSSPFIRARILALLARSIIVLRENESSLLPTIHKAWPFIINRLSDSEPYVTTEAAGLIEALVLHVGDFMARRVWEDVWPLFRKILARLEQSDKTNALSKASRRGGGIGTETAYSVSHRMYRSILAALAGVVNGVNLTDELAWEVTVSCRRFLSADAHVELQAKARELYSGIARHNPDMVWLVLCATMGADKCGGLALPQHLYEAWDLDNNARMLGIM